MTDAKLQSLTIRDMLTDRGKRDSSRKMQAIENFREQVRLQLEKMRWTYKELGEAVNMTPSRIATVLSPKRSRASVKTLTKIANALDCSIDIRLTTYHDATEYTPKHAIPSFEQEFHPYNSLAVQEWLMRVMTGESLTG